jgi:hypothetical protein
MVTVWAPESRLQACEGQLDQSISYRPRDRSMRANRPNFGLTPFHRLV